uniref:C-type lectin domain-containing protein n=1 Tax=Neogobius melanostomus TaxID=47308 RepID=A0A8C6TB31_9GOBI
TSQASFDVCNPLHYEAAGFSLLLAAAWAQTQGANEAFGEDVERASGKWQTYNGRSFIFQSSSVSWAHAQQRCVSLGGNLATIHNQQEEEFVSEVAKGSAAWIGSTDAQQDGLWLWINSKPMTFTGWCVGEPNNHRGPQQCAVINFSGLYPGWGWCHWHKCKNNADFLFCS